MSDNFKRNTISGLKWTFLDYFVVKGISFATNIILARMLSPKEFGIMGSIAIIIAMANTMVDAGLTSSLIRTQNIDNDDYSTVFITNFATSLLLYIILFFLAPLVADFYNLPILVIILRVYGLVFVFTAIYAVQMTVLVKKLQFKKITLLNIPGIIVGAIIGITMGYLEFGVWSLVCSYLSIQVVNMVIFTYYSSWKISFNFSIDKFKYHLNYGYKLLLTGLLGNIFNNIYNVIIGKLFPVRHLGYFERANTFSQYPSTVLIMMIGKVSFPILSEYQSDLTELKHKFQEFVKSSFYVSVLLMLQCAFLGNSFFTQVLGDKWQEAVYYFSYFCYAGMFLPIHALNTNILKIMGRTDLIFKMEVVMKAIILVTLGVALFFGIRAIAIAILINAIILLLLNVYFVSKVIPYSFTEQLADLFRNLVPGLFILGAFRFIKHINPVFDLQVFFLMLFCFFSCVFYIIFGKVLSLKLSIYIIEWIENKVIKR